MKRTVGISIIAIVAIVVGALQLLASIGYIGAVSLPTLFSPLFLALGGIFGFAMAYGVLGVAALTFGIGAWLMKPWSWVLGVVLTGTNLILAVVQLFVLGFVIAPVFIGVVSVAILAYLYSPSVRTAFDHEDASLFHSGHTMAGAS